jgi:hypothetical protein
VLGAARESKIREVTYIMVVDQYDDNRIFVDFLNGIEVSSSIDLVQASIISNAGPILLGADGTVGFALKVAAAAITPFKECFVCNIRAAAKGVFLSIIASKTVGANVAIDVHAMETQNAATNGVRPFVTASGLIVASVVDDTLDTSGVARSKGNWR